MKTNFLISLKSRFFIYFIFLILIDQVVKYVVCLNISCLVNTGSAFSIFSGVNFYSAIVGYLGLIIGLTIIYHRTYLLNYFSQFIIYLFTAGVISNSLDRVIFGGVRDMIKIPYLDFLGVFNIADIYLTFVCIYAVYVLFFHK